MTTAPAPTIAQRPTVTGATQTARAPSDAPSFDDDADRRPVVRALELAVHVDGTGWRSLVSTTAGRRTLPARAWPARTRARSSGSSRCRRRGRPDRRRHRGRRRTTRRAPRSSPIWARCQIREPGPMTAEPATSADSDTKAVTTGSTRRRCARGSADRHAATTPARRTARCRASPAGSRAGRTTPRRTADTGRARSISSCSGPHRRNVRHVSPGRTDRTCRCSALYAATYSGSSGRGPDDAHVAAEHVDDLRELVQLARPQEPPDRCDPVVSRPGDPRATALGPHRAELQHHDRSPVPPDALRPVDHRPGTRELHRNRDRRCQRQRDRQRGDAETDVEQPLPGVARPARRGHLHHDRLRFVATTSRTAATTSSTSPSVIRG